MDLQQATKNLIYKDPFYGHIALGLSKKFSNKISTACAAIRNIEIELFFNEDFFNSLNDNQKVGLMQHELAHVCLFHLLHVCDYSNKNVWNIACDMTINQYIDKGYLPPKAILPTSFPDITLDPFMDTKYYYNKLIDHIGSSEKLKKLVEYMDGGGLTSASHELWGEIDGFENIVHTSSQSLRSLIQKQLEAQIKDVYQNILNSSPSLVPGYLRNFVSDLVIKKEQVLDWRMVVRSFRSYCEKQQHYITSSRINKRYQDNAAISFRNKKKILIGLDTSGSISNELLEDFFQQVLHLQKTGTEISVCEWDVGIQRIYDFNNKNKWKNESVKGGGGTNPYQVVEELNNNNSYNSAIMFTDGFIAGEWDKSMSKPILWVITKNGSDNFGFPGKKIKAI